ncbi:MAG: class I SAM-dependent methyltransferase [Pseudomonadota bacterium]
MTRHDGWDASADAWVRELGADGDFARVSVLDRPMLARIDAAPRSIALDVGCGEGRFCRKIAQRGIRAVGVDAAPPMIAAALRRDPDGEYLVADAAALPFKAASFDVVVAYLSLLDVDDAASAIAEMARVLTPGGMLLVANLNGFVTANPHNGWIKAGEKSLFPIDNYLSPRPEWVEWRGIRVRNWHRPLRDYMRAFLGAGLRLTQFDEPAPHGGEPERASRYTRVPYFVLMEWHKDAQP